MSSSTKSSHKGDALIVVSDMHVNSTTAICQRRFNLDDGGSYYASPLQRALLNSFRQFIRDAKTLTEGYRRIVIFNGDVGELDTKKRSIQLITLNKSNILRMVIDVAEPLIDIADAIVVIRGTPAHTGKASWLEEELARDLDDDLVIPATNDIYSHYHFVRKIDGVGFDIAHHSRMSQMRQTQKAYGQRLAVDTMDKYKDRGQAPPDVVIRSHNHRRADSGLNWPTFAMYTPSWQLPNEYVFRIGGENDSADIGGDIFLCTNEVPNNGGAKGLIHPKFIWYPLNYTPMQQKHIWKKLDF